MGLKESAGKAAAVAGIVSTVIGTPNTGADKAINNYGKAAQTQTTRDSYGKAAKAGAAESQTKSSQKK